MTYHGPIIDAHHHLWDLSLGAHPWITAGLPGFGDMRFLQADYGIAELLADGAGQTLVGSVHIEAAWDPAGDPVAETRWLDGLARPPGIAGRYVVQAPLIRPDIEALLDRHLAQSPRVAGVRETIRWHPDPARRWAEQGLVDRPDWRRGLAAATRRGLSVDLLMNPFQGEEVARLAAAAPDAVLIINHCLSPLERDSEGLARWRRALAVTAARPNVAIKVSNFGATLRQHDQASLESVVMPCIEAFGTARTMFGTDFPVARRTLSYAAQCGAFRAMIAGFSADEQRALFHDNAARIYRFPGATPPS